MLFFFFNQSSAASIHLESISSSNIFLETVACEMSTTRYFKFGIRGFTVTCILNYSTGKMQN